MGRVGVWDPREKEKWSDEADESYDLIFRRAAGILGAGVAARYGVVDRQTTASG